MNLQHVNVKVFVDGDLNVELQRFIETFHQWIVREATEEMLIDVADYRHVPDGPGVMLIGLESDYAIDHTNGQPGLLYNRKAPLEGGNGDRFLHSFCCALQGCEMLESELEGLQFSRRRFEVIINDRALAPNTPETREVFRHELTDFLQSATGDSGFSLDVTEDPRRRVSAVVELSQPLELELRPAGV